MLQEMERRAFAYFRDQADARTGIVKDRAGNFDPDRYRIGSIAATGFGLASLVIGVRRGWMSRPEAHRRALRTLRFIARLPHEKGWLYHFIDTKTGKRLWNCEISTIDTALFIAGALSAGASFPGSDVDRAARRLYERIDFNWMRTDGGSRPDEPLISHGWTPEGGFLKNRWDHYCEHPILYLLALSSPVHPIPPSSWTAWDRMPGRIGPYEAQGIHLPLFVHQFTHCFVDLKNRRDSVGDDFWRNSESATLANRWFCLYRQDSRAGREEGTGLAYGPNLWGLSAVDGPDGYRAYAPAPGDHDGTVSPIAVAAAIPFAPEECLNALLSMKRLHGDRIWGRYGFSALHAGKNWRGADMIGIDIGAALLMIDRYRYGEPVIGKLLEKSVLWRGLAKAGFRRGSRRG